jgi:hypothetical protein
MYPRFHRNERGQSLVIVLSLITILFLLGSALAVHASAALRATRASAGQGNDFYAADAATELGIWWQRNGKAGNPPAQTINGVTTSTTITTAGGGGGSCPADPTPDWLSGLESGVFYKYVNNVAPNTLPRPSDGSWPNGGWYDTNPYGPPPGATVVTTPVRTGNYSLQVDHPGALAATRFATPYPTYGVWRFSVYLPSLPAADLPVGRFVVTGGSNNVFEVFYQASTQKWAAGWGWTAIPSAVVQVGTVTASAGVWTSFDVRVSANNQDPRVGDWMVDGVAQTSVSLVEGTNATNVSTWYMGYWPSPSIDYSYYFDDIVVSRNPNDYPLGDIRIAPLSPNGMGTHNTPGNYQQQVGATSSAIVSTSYQTVDEVPMTSTTDMIKMITAGGASYIEMGFPDTTQTCIRGASVVAALRAAGTQSDLFAINSVANGFNYNIFSGDVSNTTIWYWQGMISQSALTPGTGPWNQSAINGLVVRAGMSTDAVAIPYLDSIIVEYGYRPMGGGGPATVTIVGTAGGSTTTTTYPDAGAGVPTLSTWTVTK